MAQLPASEMPLTTGRRTRRMTNLACGFGAFASVMFAVFTVRLMVRVPAIPAESRAFMWVAVIAGVITTLLLLAGTVFMWSRQPAGQVIQIVASAVGVAYAVSFTVYNYFHGPDTYGAGDIGVVVAQTLLGVIPPAAALICTAIAASNHAAHRSPLKRKTPGQAS